MKLLSISLFILYSLEIAYSQEPSYRALTTQNGLAQNQVVAFLQDSKGFVWLGTKAGLSRFDGLKFRNFYEEDGLPDSFISTITECPEGNIYVLTRKGFAVYQGDEFTPYYHRDGVDFYKWRKSEVITTHIYDNKIFTHSSSDNLIFDDGKYYLADSIFPDISEYEILSSWFSEDRKKIIFSDRKNENLYKYSKEQIYTLRSNAEIRGHFCPLPGNGVLVQFTDSIIAFNSNLHIDSVFYFDWETYGFIFYVDEDGNLFSRNNRNQLYVKYKSGEIDFFQFNIPLITNVEKDKEGNLWILGERGALILQSEAFLNYTRLQGAPDYTWAIVEEPGKGVWLATYGEGLFFFNGKEFKKIRVENLPSGGLKDAFYMGAIRDSQNRIWFPHSYGLVMVKNGKAVFQDQLPQEFTLYAYEEPYSGDLYFAQMNQLTILRPKGNIDKYNVYPGNKKGIIVSITSDRSGNIWIGNAYGISIWDGTEFNKLSDNGIDFNKGAVTLKTDHKHNIWIGNKSGLYFYDYSGAIQKIEFNWEGHYVTDLQLVDSTGLFIGLIGGMAYLDLVEFYEKKTIQIDYYNHLNGFLGMEVLQNGSFATDDGKVWIAASDRVILFDPQKRKILNGRFPELILTNISGLTLNMEWESIDFDVAKNTNILKVPHNKNHIRFDFIGVTMLHPEIIEYKYRLVGLEENWSTPITERYVSFAYLPPGEYIFELNVRNHHGNWSEDPVSFSFIINKPWWKTWQARIIFLVLGLTSVIILAYWITNRLKREKLKKLNAQKQVAELRLEALKAQVDPHFIFNVLSSVGSSIYKGEKNEAYKNLTRFSKLIRQAFETNEKPYNSIKSEINFVNTYLELQQQRFKNAFDFEIYIGKEIEETVLIPRMLIQTLVENAIKHGVAPSKEPRKILVSIKRENNHFNLLVEDNGVGRRNSAGNNNGSTGRGLNIARELFDIFNSYNKEKIQFNITDLLHDDNSPAGTRVQVTIPVDFEFEIFEKQKIQIL